MTPMKKLKLYIETSVWSHLFATDAPDARQTAEKLFTEIADYEIFVSDLVFQELERTPNDVLRKKLRESIEHYQPQVLVAEEDANILVKRYIESGVIPPAARDDAIHIATAVVEDLDVVVSLNMRHIVRVRTRMGINGVNKIEGFREIEIATPAEVIKYAEEL